MIVNEYVVTKDLYMKWFTEGVHKGVSRKISIMWIVVLGVLVLATVVYFILSPRTVNASPWLLLEVAFMIYAIFNLFFRRRLDAMAMYDKMAEHLGKDWTAKIEFHDDVIVAREGAFDICYPYKDIVSVKNFGDEIVIEFEKGNVVHLYKNKFIQGDYTVFRRFIESKAVMKCFLK